MTSWYYDRQGGPLETLEWGRLFGDMTYKQVRLDQLMQYRISTVWTGLSMGIGAKPERIFQTALLRPEFRELDWYETEAEAVLGHARACFAVLRCINDNVPFPGPKTYPLQDMLSLIKDAVLLD